MFDYLIIESTGISEPQQVAETFTFTFDNSSAVSLSDVARLDTCVTVVDAANFFTNYHSISVANSDDEMDERTLVDLMVDQLEFANVVLLNKVDLISENERGELLALIRKMNAKAKIICTRFSDVDLKNVINTGLFSMEEAKLSPGWLHELRVGVHKPETEEYGIGSFTYCTDHFMLLDFGILWKAFLWFLRLKWTKRNRQTAVLQRVELKVTQRSATLCFNICNKNMAIYYDPKAHFGWALLPDLMSGARGVMRGFS